MEISNISNIGNISEIKNLNKVGLAIKNDSIDNISESKDSFINSIKKGLDSVQKIQDEANEKIKNTITSNSADPTDAIISMVKAEISMQLTLQIRNKLIEAYNEITRMQI